MYLHGVVEEHDAHAQHQKKSGEIAGNGPALFAEPSCNPLLHLKLLRRRHDRLDDDENVLQTQHYHKKRVHLAARCRPWQRRGTKSVLMTSCVQTYMVIRDPCNMRSMKRYLFSLLLLGPQFA